MSAMTVVPEIIHTHPISLEIPRGRGVLKGKFLEAMYENKEECPGGRGVQNKNLSWGE